MKKSVLVLFGGISPEHFVSIDSGYTIIQNIDKNIYNVLPIGITQKGEWRYLINLESLKTLNWEDENNSKSCSFIIEEGIGKIIIGDEKFKVDVFFPMLHGPFGEDGTVQGLFELLEIPIVGPKTLSSALCMDKDKAHKIVQSLGYNVPKGILISDKDNLEDGKNLNYPVFVKPLKGGSSIGIKEVESPSDLKEAVEFAFLYDDRVVIEEKIEGFEVFCGIMGNDNLVVGDLEEVELLGGFLNSDKKTDLYQVNTYIPARLSKDKTEEIKNMAMEIYKALDCQVYSRVDVFVGNDGKIYFNEVNTTPGFTKTSAFPMMMDSIGIEIKELIEVLIEMAI